MDTLIVEKEDIATIADEEENAPVAEVCTTGSTCED